MLELETCPEIFMQKLILKEKTNNTPSHTPLKPSLRNLNTLNSAKNKSKYKTPFQRLKNEQLPFTTPKIKSTPRVKVFNDSILDIESTKGIDSEVNSGIKEQELVKSDDDIDAEYCPPRTEMAWGADQDDIDLLKGDISLRIIKKFPEPVYQLPTNDSDFEGELQALNDFVVDLELDTNDFLLSI